MAGLDTRFLMVTAIGALALTPVGCGFDEEEAGGPINEQATVTIAPAPTVAPGTTYTLTQLGPALPALDELPPGFEPRYGCASDPFPECTVPSDATRAFVQYQRGAGFETTTLSMTATAHTDGVSAAEDLIARRDQADLASGAIDDPVEPQGEAIYSPGREGHGTVADSTVDGWVGFQESAAYDQIDEFYERHPTRFERLVVAAGNVIIDAELEVPAAAPPDLTIEDVITSFIADLPR